MTPKMSRRRAQRPQGQLTRSRFRLGEIEALPVADASVDVIISNCGSISAPTSGRFTARLSRPSGRRRLAVSDVVARHELADDVKRDLALHSAA